MKKLIITYDKHDPRIETMLQLISDLKSDNIINVEDKTDVENKNKNITLDVTARIYPKYSSILYGSYKENTIVECPKNICLTDMGNLKWDKALDMYIKKELFKKYSCSIEVLDIKIV